MDRRRREWEDEIEKMRKEFFMLRPEGGGTGSGLAGEVPGGGVIPPIGRGAPRSRLMEQGAATLPDDSRGMVVKDDKGNPVFKVRSDQNLLISKFLIFFFLSFTFSYSSNTFIVQ